MSKDADLSTPGLNNDAAGTAAVAGEIAAIELGRERWPRLRIDIVRPEALREEAGAHSVRSR